MNKLSFKSVNLIQEVNANFHKYQAKWFVISVYTCINISALFFMQDETFACVSSKTKSFLL